MNKWLISTVSVLILGAVCPAGIKTVAAQTIAPERVVWVARPIPVHVQTSHERIIHFPDAIRYWLPDSLQGKVSVIAAGGVLYIQALESFPATRMRVQGLNDQQLFLLDVVADSSASAQQEMVVMLPDHSVNRTEGLDPEPQSQDWRVRLTRHAAQALYAPERLLAGDSAIRRVPLMQGRPIPLIRGGQVEAVPLASWQGGGLTVTAVKLRNLQEEAVSLGFETATDPNTLDLRRAVRGHWLTMTLQHTFLGSPGQGEDTTTLYLVSAQGFVESLDFLLPDTDPAEAQDNG